MKLSHLLTTLLLSTSLAFASSIEYEEARKLYDNKSYSLAYKKAKPLAKKGDADAINLIGKMHFEGKGTNKNVIWSIKLFNEAAARGNVDAANNLEVVRKTYRQHLIDYDSNFIQQKLISWLTTIDPEYKDKLMFDGVLFNMPMPSKFVNTYPYEKADHKELPPIYNELDFISYTLKQDLDDFIKGKDTSFSYQSLLFGCPKNLSQSDFKSLIDDIKVNKDAFIRKVSKELFNKMHDSTASKDDVQYEVLVDNKDSFIRYINFKGVQFAEAIIRVKGKLFRMALVDITANSRQPLKEDITEWVELILKSNQ